METQRSEAGASRGGVEDSESKKGSTSEQNSIKSFDWTLGIARLLSKQDEEDIRTDTANRDVDNSDAESLASEFQGGYTAEDKAEEKRAAEVPRGFRRARIFWWNVLSSITKYKMCTTWNGLWNNEEEMKVKEHELHQELAQKLLDVILELRGSYVKVGQQLCMAQILPKEYTDKLSILMDGLQPKPMSVIRRIIRESLGDKKAAQIKHVDTKALGAASIGQAHIATLKNGEQAVVKVMYPEVEELFVADIDNTKKVLRWQGKEDFLKVVETAEKQMLLEFDFIEEARSMNAIRESMLKNFPKEVYVPKANVELSSRKVLTMEHVPGRT
eukprot:CAMPEP_0118950612 /NCGR_PEP_ID=MMETSP1169-20130426/51696_1 /TAXON_ID=36882 /ORGANISM="Pyramimonas obovata, Strain CCMP722" /LENGTH=328 /DNA_ID=CAMNT_0006897495 /DNA_START=103 /DNA_END=1085 /DNA_ORIENTATION=-